MNSLQTILAVLALVCFIVEALGIQSRINLVALGLAFFAAAVLFA